MYQYLLFKSAESKLAIFASKSQFLSLYELPGRHEFQLIAEIVPDCNCCLRRDLFFQISRLSMEIVTLLQDSAVKMKGNNLD